MNIETKPCTVKEKDSEFSYEYYEVTNDNFYHVKNNASINSYAPNRPLDIKIGDYIVIMKSPFYRSLIHTPRKKFEDNYKKTTEADQSPETPAEPPAEEGLSSPSCYAPFVPVWEALHKKTQEAMMEEGDPLESHERRLYDELTDRMADSFQS